MHGIVYLRYFTFTQSCVMSDLPPIWDDGYLCTSKSEVRVTGMSALFNSGNKFL